MLYCGETLKKSISMILLDFFGVIVELLSSDNTQMTNIVLTHYHGVTKARNL